MFLMLDLQCDHLVPTLLCSPCTQTIWGSGVVQELFFFAIHSMGCSSLVLLVLNVVIVCMYQGTPERLIMHLVEEPSVVDPTYIEDFLLTYRTFLSSPMEVGKKLLEWFKVDTLRDTVSVCVFTVFTLCFLL